MFRRSRSGMDLYEAGLTFYVGVLLFAVAAIVGMAFWTDRNMDYLLTWIKGAPVNCPMWLSTLIAIAGNGAAVAFNIIMEAIRLVR